MVTNGLVTEARHFLEEYTSKRCNALFAEKQASDGSEQCTADEMPTSTTISSAATGMVPCSNFQYQCDELGSRGVTAAIGFKELLPYLLTPTETLEPHRVSQSKNEELLISCIDKVNPIDEGVPCCEVTVHVIQIKISTIRYAKRQKTWMQNRLLPTCHRSVDRVPL